VQGFVGFRIPLWLRRLVTMAPSFAVGAVGFDATQALILSQGRAQPDPPRPDDHSAHPDATP
jgi:Mn2+/Fe2+ NRAMP family transporter